MLPHEKGRRGEENWKSSQGRTESPREVTPCSWVTEQARAYSHKLPVAASDLPGFPISQHCVLGIDSSTWVGRDTQSIPISEQ